jgi:hypothetical protein
MKTSNDNATASKTPTFDAVLAALAITYTGTDRWVLEGWATHIREARHALHAINSLVKHTAEISDAAWPAAFVLTVARCVDAGMGSSTAAAEIHARRAARAQKVA